MSENTTNTHTVYSSGGKNYLGSRVVGQLDDWLPAAWLAGWPLADWLAADWLAAGLLAGWLLPGWLASQYDFASSATNESNASSQSQQKPL